MSFGGSEGDLDTDHGWSLTDLSIMLLLTDFNRRLYLENKPTQKMCSHLGFFPPVHDAYLKCMEEVALCLARLKRPVSFGLVSKFIQWKFCLLQQHAN